LNDDNHINDNNNVLASNIDVDINDHFISLSYIYSRSWGIFYSKTKGILIENGPIKKLNLTFPMNKLSKHFSYSYLVFQKVE